MEISSKNGQLQIVKQILSIGYKFVSANRHLLCRIFWLKVIVAGGLISGLLLSVKLWSGSRFFPFAPIFKNSPAIPFPLDIAVFALLLGLLAAVIVAPKPRKFIFAALVVVATLTFCDQMRWQPWFYQYCFMLATLGLFPWNNTDTERREATLNTCRLIVASIYFYSGLQKVNPAFMGSEFPWIVEPIAKFFPVSLQISLFSLGVVVPFIEMGIGIGLLTQKYRKYTIALAIVMHAFMLFALGPLGHDWNSVVWPWNIAMTLFVIILFWRTENLSFQNILWVKNSPFQKVVFVLFAIMPAFSFFNLWDSYLSSTLYSGNTNSAQIYISDSVRNRLPAEVQRYVAEVGPNKNALDFFNWSFGELNVPPYPEARVYKDIARGICKYADGNNVVLIVNGKPTLFNRDHQSIYDCSNL
jgi:hypothetical protein